MKKDNLLLIAAFACSLIGILILPTFFPLLRLTFFAPFLILTYYKKSLIHALWCSLACGLIIDLLSAHTPLGLYPLNYCITTWLLYRQRSNFFEDNLSTLPLMTFFFAFISTTIQALLATSFDNNFNFSWRWVGTDLLVMPSVDALYAFLLFTLPMRKKSVVESLE